MRSFDNIILSDGWLWGINMSEPKVLFVKQFLANLCKDDCLTIPINNEKFKLGIEAMAKYYNENKSEFGPYTERLDMLFLKYSTKGEYKQFSRIIESFNGRIVSLENPHYIRANLKLEADYIEELVNDTELGIAPEQYKCLVECFKVGSTSI